jgi:hypothetical protein
MLKIRPYLNELEQASKDHVGRGVRRRHHRHRLRADVP